MTKKNSVIWDHQEIRTFAYLHSAADWAVEQAQSVEEGQMFPSMHAILTSVHCMEAFTNHLGPSVFGEDWDKKEASLAAPKEKLRALLCHYRIEIADIQSEYNSYMIGLGIRKALTHGRTHEINRGKTHQMVEGSAVSATPPDWQKHCNPRTANRVFNAVTLIVERLGEASGEGKYCWAVLGSGYGWQEKN